MDRRRAGRERRPPRGPGCCRSTAPGSRSAASRCRRSRRSTGRPSARGSASRWPATCGTPPPVRGWACRSSDSACTPGWAATFLLPEAVGAAHARDLLLTGRLVDADEALRLGLVSRVIDSARFAEEVLEAAVGIAATAPIASRLTKLALADGATATSRPALQWEALAQPVTLATADLQEGIRAARENRPPSFTGADLISSTAVDGVLAGQRVVRRPIVHRATRPVPGISTGEPALGRLVPTGYPQVVHRPVGPPAPAALTRVVRPPSVGARRGPGPRRSTLARGRQVSAAGRGLFARPPPPLGRWRGGASGRGTGAERCWVRSPALRRIAFLLERGREDTFKVQAFRKAAAAILPLPADEVARLVAEDRLTDLPGIGASSGKVIAAAVRGRGARAAGRRWRPRNVGPAGAGRPGAAGRAPWRPALPLGLVRRRLADRGDGVHRGRARPRLPRAHRPLAAAHRRPRPQRRTPRPPARRRRRGQRPPRRLLHPAQGHRGRHPRRRRPRPDRRDAGPAPGPGRQRALQAQDGARADDPADDRRPSATRS